VYCKKRLVLAVLGYRNSIVKLSIVKERAAQLAP